MRTYPRTQLKEDAKKQADARIKEITRKVAIAFIMLIQLAIIFKMLI
jgi:hypothetical protein